MTKSFLDCATLVIKSPVKPSAKSLALPQEIEHWSLTTLREKLVKIGAKIVSHGR